MKVFVYPQHKEKQVLNPYTNNMERALGTQFQLIHSDYKLHLPQPLRLLLGSIKSDVYVLNWVESVTEGDGNAAIRFIMTMLALWVIRFRKSKIVWIFHNIHPHSGETRWSLRIKRFLFRHSTIIVSHSNEAYKYAKQYASCPVYFKNHPIELKDYDCWNGELKECDYYIWGNIYPYKGIAELASNPLCKSSGRMFYIVGKCESDDLSNQIRSFCGESFIYENRRASFDEVAAQCRKAKYVLFPYVGDSVSSSGALMDTLLMGGTPVGPNRGAFADMAELGCCITYETINDIFDYPVSEDTVIKLSKAKVHDFLLANTWDSFAKWLVMTIKCI